MEDHAELKTQETQVVIPTDHITVHVGSLVVVGTPPWNLRIFTDGHELHRVRELTLRVAVGEATTLTVTSFVLAQSHIEKRGFAGDYSVYSVRQGDTADCGAGAGGTGLSGQP